MLLDPTSTPFTCNIRPKCWSRWGRRVFAAMNSAVFWPAWTQYPYLHTLCVYKPKILCRNDDLCTDDQKSFSAIIDSDFRIHRAESDFTYRAVRFKFPPPHLNTHLLVKSHFLLLPFPLRWNIYIHNTLATNCHVKNPLLWNTASPCYTSGRTLVKVHKLAVYHSSTFLEKQSKIFRPT